MAVNIRYRKIELNLPMSCKSYNTYIYLTLEPWLFPLNENFSKFGSEIILGDTCDKFKRLYNMALNPVIHSGGKFFSFFLKQTLAPRLALPFCAWCLTSYMLGL